MPSHQKENKFQNFVLILMIIIVLFIIITFGYYYIRERQNQSLNNTNINDTALNDINENTLIEDNEQISQNTNTDTDENIEENEENNESGQELVIIKTISPSGFAGASNNNLRLYSDKTVYLIIYSGEGYTEKDIISKQLIAENVEDIYYDENTGGLCIAGGTKVSDGGVNWIEFK